MKTFFILNHSTSIEGACDHLEDYLLRQNNKVIKLTHPLDSYKNKESAFFINKEMKNKIKRRKIGVINLLIDFFLSCKYLLTNQFEIFIGANNFDTFAAIFIKIVFKKKILQIIYFASDFSEERFKNSILNLIYIYIEKISLKYSDLIISNTKRSQEKRYELGLSKEKGVVIPNGVYLNNPFFIPKEISKSNFIYVGSLTREHGLYEIIEEIADQIKKLVIIGSGNDFERVKKLCFKKEISLEVFFDKSHKFVINYLQKFNGIGLAPYNLKAKWTYYCSPLKVNEYIACGIPVLISDIPEISEFINSNNLGIVFSYDDLKNVEVEIRNFNINNYHLKAEKFYNMFNFDSLFNKISYGK